MTSHRLQLSLSAKGLTNLAGYINKSDPMAVVTVRGESKDNPPSIIGQTEVIFNNLNPNWSTVIFIDGFTFGVPMWIEVGVFDFDARNLGKSEGTLRQQSSEEARLITTTESTRKLMRSGQLPHKVMGTALFEVGQVLGARGNVASKSLQTGGALYAHIERSRSDGAHGVMRFQLRGISLQNARSILGTSSPFFELYRKVDTPTGATCSNRNMRRYSVYRSNVVKHDLNPKWEETRLPLEAVCNGDMHRSMKVAVRDHKRGGKHVDIGEFETTMQRFIDAEDTNGGFNEDVAFAVRRGDKIVGRVSVLKASVIADTNHKETNDKEESAATETSSAQKPKPEFLDYLAGDCQISLAVAIDFTASNGNPRQEGTPHYFYPPSSNKWNDYQKAIFAVGSILEKYDSDGLVPTWGFGAKYGTRVRHCFKCGNEEARGVEGIMEAYRKVFNDTLTMSFPTDFTEVIETAGKYAEHENSLAEKEGRKSYTILLILTAGNIENAAETKQRLIEASDKPLSVVIVGIGQSDFKSMEFLDEHDPETEGGRDITHFLRFNDYKSYNHLTAAVLEEIPGQLVDYFYSRGIFPTEAEDIDTDTVHIQPADDDERTITFLG